MKNYHEKIIKVFKPREYITYSEVFKRLKLNVYGSTKTHYYRAWQDLIVNGRLTEGLNNTYRINL